MPYLTIYHWIQTSLRQIKQSKLANYASELFMWDISSNLHLIHPVSIYFQAGYSQGLLLHFFTPAILPASHFPLLHFQSPPQFACIYNADEYNYRQISQYTDAQGTQPERSGLGRRTKADSSINQSTYLANCAATKNECQQNDVKHSDGYQKSKSLISAGRPNKYKVYTKQLLDLETDRSKYRKTDRHAQTNLITNCKSNLYNKRQPKTTIIIH